MLRARGALGSLRRPYAGLADQHGRVTGVSSRTSPAALSSTSLSILSLGRRRHYSRISHSPARCSSSPLSAYHSRAPVFCHSRHLPRLHVGGSFHLSFSSASPSSSPPDTQEKARLKKGTCEDGGTGVGASGQGRDDAGQVEGSSVGRDKTDEDHNGEHKSAAVPSGWDPALRNQVAILTCSQLVLNLGFSQMVPVMPMFAAQMGGHLGATGVGLVLAAPSVATLLLNVPLGRLCDVYGRKPLMWSGTALTAVGTISTGFASSLTTLIPCRLLVGSGSAASMTGATAYLADLSDRVPEHRAKIMGINQGIVGSVWVIGPAVGGWLAETYGYQNSFIIAGMGAGLCSLGYTQLPETLKKVKEVDMSSLSFLGLNSSPSSSNDAAASPSAPSSPPAATSLLDGFREWRTDMADILRCPNQQALIALACVFPLRFSCFSTAVALHLTAVAGGGPAALGLQFTAMALCQGLSMPVGAWLADKTTGPRMSLVLPAGFLSSASLGCTAFATSQEHFILAMALQGLGAGFLRPGVGAFTAEITPAHKRGQAMSLQRQAQSVLGLLGPVSMGLLADCTSCPTAIVVGSGLMAACHLAYAVLARRAPLI